MAREGWNEPHRRGPSLTNIALAASRDAELVAFGVEHHDMAEVLAIELLTYAGRCSSGHYS